LKGESGRGRKEGIRAVGVGTWRNPNLLCFHLLIEVRARFGVSRCLPFLLFLSTPSSSFLACSVALGSKPNVSVSIFDERSQKKARKRKQEGIRAVEMRTE
jgi:hypothetical protein